MAKKIRKQTLSLSSFLERIKEEDIRSDQDVQRLSGQWDAGMLNELIVTVLMDDYIPPIILGEEERCVVAQLWMIDGLQRGSSLLKFRYGNYRITSSIEHGIIQYQTKKTDREGQICKDAQDNIIWELTEFDIRGKTYEELPKELKQKFNDYQIELVIHQDCTMELISKLVRRYNNHKPMNASQKALTYMDRFARQVRVITEHRFFKDCGSYTEKERINGVYERIVAESIISLYHLDHWQKQSKKMGIYLNESASCREFDNFSSLLDRLEAIVGDRFLALFSAKDSFIWFALFERFTRLGVKDRRFVDFLAAFTERLHGVTLPEFEYQSYDELNLNRATKDKAVVIRKIQFLEQLMSDYLGTGRSCDHDNEENLRQFVTEMVQCEVSEDEIELYQEVLYDLTVNVDNTSKLLEKENHFSLVALVAYSFEQDIDLEEWMVEYFETHRSYLADQRGNFEEMRGSVERYVGVGRVGQKEVMDVS